MSSINRNKQSDANILRANDIMPSYKVRPAQKVPAELADAKQQAREIPKFDLDDEVMAEQRKVTAARRKAPNKKSAASSQEDEVESIGHAVVQPTPLFPKQHQIITEIVARDIAKLCEGSTYDHATFFL